MTTGSTKAQNPLHTKIPSGGFGKKNCLVVLTVDLLLPYSIRQPTNIT